MQFSIPMVDQFTNHNVQVNLHSINLHFTIFLFLFFCFKRNGKYHVFHMYPVSLEPTTSPSTLLLQGEETSFEHRAYWQHF